MPRVRDVLLRFRPSGAPGAATAAGVPVDRAGELATELGPVLDLLAETERECAAVLERARLEEREIRARETERARGVIASGRAHVEAERSAAAARSRAGGGPGSPGAAAPQQRAGSTGGAVAEDALAQHVDLVVGAVRSLWGDGASTDDVRAGAR